DRVIPGGTLAFELAAAEFACEFMKQPETAQAHLVLARSLGLHATEVHGSVPGPFELLEDFMFGTRLGRLLGSKRQSTDHQRQGATDDRQQSRIHRSVSFARSSNSDA